MKLARSEAGIRALVYLMGYLRADEAISKLCEDVLPEMPDTPAAAIRYLMATFDYYYAADGSMVLLHPGLAEPEKLLLPAGMEDIPDYSPIDMVSACQGILPQEIPATLRLAGLIGNAVRPELTPQEAVDDLRIMAKQGASLP